MVLDHISIPVGNLAISKRFYASLLATLDLSCTRRRDNAVGFGPDGLAPVFWLLSVEATATATPGRGLHISFAAQNRNSVDRFHETGLRLGAIDAGKPGMRAQYTAPFYGAFLIDPDGFKIEAVCRADEE